MLLLSEGEVCPLALRCPYAQECWGVKSNRDTVFTCSFVDDRGNIKEGMFRNPHDKTGKMQVIVD
jgi:hypothetical protein